MNRSAPSFSRSLGCSIIPLLVAGLAHAHGGQYRGPGGIVPPGNSTSPSTSNNQTSGSTVPGNNSPAAPSSSGGGRAGAGGSAKGAGASSATPRGYLVGDDLGRWEYWWEFGKDPYLQLRDAIYKERRGDPQLKLWNPRMAADAGIFSPPTGDDVRAVAVQLAALLKSSDDRDTSSASLLALARALGLAWARALGLTSARALGLALASGRVAVALGRAASQRRTREEAASPSCLRLQQPLGRRRCDIFLFCHF